MANDSTEGIISGSSRIGSLSETQTVDLISEGEIQGLVTKEYKFAGTLGNIGYTSASLVKSQSPLASVYWNNVPVIDEQGNFNYQDVNVKESVGSKNGSTQPLTRSETDDELFKFLETTQVINERLRGPTKGGSDFPDNAEYFKKVYRVLNTDCFAIKLNVKIVALNTVNKDNGSVQDNSVSIVAETRALFINDEESFSNENDQGVNPNLNQGQSPLGGTFKGRVSSPFVKSYFIDFSKRSDFANIMNNPNFLGWEIKVYKQTPDPITTDSTSRVMVDSVTEVYRAKLSYPNAATVSSSFSAEYFSQIPTRSFDVEMMKVKIPSNYDPLTRTYHGDWDGTFSTESVGPFSTGPGTDGITQSDGSSRELKKYYTNNPAWCFYDLITNERYGLGKYITEQGFDKWTLYEIGQYCDTLVYDGMGKGELEPRFTCNTLIQSREDAFKVVQDMASVFRGLSYYAAGQIYAIQDAPKNPVYQFTNANVEEGNFSYNNTSRKVRNNVAVVRYNDKHNFYKPAVEYTEDVDGIRKNGIRETEVTAFGCSSRGQAIRLGKWMLATENLETETVTFTAGLEGTYLRPGDVISVSDTNRRNITRNGGRTVNIDQSNNNTSGVYAEITLDSTLDVYRQGDVNNANDPAQMYKLSVLVPKATLDPYNVTDIRSSDTSEIRSSQVQTLSFLGNQVDNYERYYESNFAVTRSEWTASFTNTATVTTDPDAPAYMSVTASTDNSYHRIIFQDVPNVVVGRKYRFKARINIPTNAVTARGIQFRHGNGNSNAGPIVHPTLGEWTDIEYEWIATDESHADHANQISLWIANSSSIDTTATFQWAGDGGGLDRFGIYNIVVEPAIEKNQSRITFSGGYYFDLNNTTIQQDQTVWAVSPTGGDSLLNSQGITIDSDDISEDYRIVNVKEERRNKYVVSAIEYSEEKYSLIEEEFEANADGVNVSTTLPNSPSAITLDESTAPGASHTKLIKYTVSPPVDQIALAGYEVYMKKSDTQSWVIADYTGRYPTLWTDNNGNVTFMQENPLVNDENYVPDSKYRIGRHPKSDSTIEKEVVATTSSKYYFKAVSFNGLGNHSAKTVKNNIEINDSEAIKDVVISNLRLEGDTQLLNDSAELQTLDGGITAYTGASPNLLWDTSIQGAGQLATQFNYAISLRQTIDPNIREGSDPTNNIFSIITGFQPTLTQDGSFVYSIPADDLATIQTNEGESNARNFDVVVEAHTEDGLTSAGGQIVASASTFAEKYALNYTEAKGWDIAVLNNVQIDNPRFSESADDCGDLDRICTLQSITSDNRLKIEFTKNTYKANEKDVAGGFFYSSPTQFAKEEIAGKTQSFFNDESQNTKNIQRVRMDNYSDVMYVPFKGELLTKKLFCAYSLFDTFDRDIESVYLNQNPNNTNYNPDYDLGSTLPLSSVSEVDFVDPLAATASKPKLHIVYAKSESYTTRPQQKFGNVGSRNAGTWVTLPVRNFSLTKPLGKTELVSLNFKGWTMGGTRGSSNKSGFHIVFPTSMRVFYDGVQVGGSNGFLHINRYKPSNNFYWGHGGSNENITWEGVTDLGLTDKKFPEGETSLGTISIQFYYPGGWPQQTSVSSQFIWESLWV
jgi:hypothetical protein